MHKWGQLLQTRQMISWPFLKNHSFVLTQLYLHFLHTFLGSEAQLDLDPLSRSFWVVNWTVILLGRPRYNSYSHFLPTFLISKHICQCIQSFSGILLGIWQDFLYEMRHRMRFECFLLVFWQKLVVGLDRFFDLLRSYTDFFRV